MYVYVGFPSKSTTSKKELSIFINAIFKSPFTSQYIFYLSR